jgi:hypothetical protein
VLPKQKQAEELQALVEKKMKKATIKQVYSATEQSALALLRMMTDMFWESQCIMSIIKW